MRNILISLLSTAILLVLTLAMVPFFVSTDFLKTQVEQFVKQQSGMTLGVSGDVTLSLLTGLRLSAETVSLSDANDKPLVAITRLDFALALSPLLSGKADITAITLVEPVLTLNQATSEQATSGSSAEAPSQPGTGLSSNPAAMNSEDIDLSALSLRRLGIRDAKIVRIDGGGHETILLSGLNATLRAPDFDGAADLEGSLPVNDRDIAFSGEIASIREAINGRETGIGLDVTSDLIKARLEGALTLKGDALLVANYAINAGNGTHLIDWALSQKPPLSVGKMQTNGSIIVAKNEIRLPALTLAIDKQEINAAARIFTSDSLARPLLRLAVDASTLNLDTILNDSNIGQTADQSANAEQPASSEGEETNPDLSALREFDLTLDLRAGRVTYQGKSVRQLKLIAHLLDGKLQADLKSANLAKGNLEASLTGTLEQLLWNGSIKVHQIDIEEAANLAAQQSLLSGMISSEINFAARGLSSGAISKNGNIAGTISLSNGSFSHPALEAAIPERDSGSITNLTSQITINTLETPINIAGSFGWNGEILRYSSRLGLAEALQQRPVPTRIALEARPLSLALSAQIDPNNVSLSGSTLSVKSPSSRALLSWLGQPVTSGTPDLPLDLSTNLSVASNKTSLQNLSLQMGPSKGTGSLTFLLAGKPTINGALAFQTLDLTPFMGDGTSQGRIQAAQSTARATPANQGWDNSPIDFSGLNSINADLSLSAQSLVARDIKTGPVQMTARIQDGQLTGSLDRLSLYQGQGTGGFVVNGQAKPADISANFALSNMEMAGFLRDSIDMKALSGRGGVTLDLTSRGASQEEIINQLDGSAKLDMRDGQIRGINIPQMLRRLRGNILEGWATAETQTTDFSSLTASFQLNKGLVRNEDLSMLSPLLRLTGAGTIDLPNSRIDYKATPKLSTNLQGQGGLVDAKGVPIPIVIKGNLTKPRIYPDIPGILQNPDAILQGLEQLGSPGKAASQGIRRIEKNITKEIEKQSDKLGIDLNKLIRPQTNRQEENNNQSQQDLQQRPIEEQLLRDLTKGLFGN